jgi:hypothetical protein
MHAARVDGANEALFTLKQTDDGFIIGTGNYIDQLQVEPLHSTLDELHEMQKPELNALYREKLRLLIDENAAGVGIGLIYIFRKSSEVKYAIVPQGNRYLLSFMVRI